MTQTPKLATLNPAWVLKRVFFRRQIRHPSQRPAAAPGARTTQRRRAWAFGPASRHRLVRPAPAAAPAEDTIPIAAAGLSSTDRPPACPRPAGNVRR